MLEKYNFSPSQLISSVYSEFDWLPWRFYRCPNYYWEDLNNQRKFVDWVGKNLNIKEMSDWYKVTSQVFNKYNDNPYLEVRIF